jgi:hypothetical protein
MQLSLIASVVSLAMFVNANPTPVRAHAVDLNKRSGCGSSGPLNTGHFKIFITTECTAGESFVCKAMDASGCVPGEAKHIGSMEVDDPNDTTQFATESHTNAVGFQCPAGGQIRCQVNFEDNDDGPQYSLRVDKA